MSVCHAHKGNIGVAVSEAKTTLVRVYGIEPPDPWYSSVLLQFCDPAGEPFAVRMTSVDAQSLGHSLNRAGGGVVFNDAKAAVHVRALLDAIGPLREDDLSDGSKLLAAYKAAAAWLRNRG